MPTNHQTDRSNTTERGAVVFWGPPPSQLRLGSRVQIIDVFSLQDATGYTRYSQGKLRLEAQPWLPRPKLESDQSRATDS